MRDLPRSAGGDENDDPGNSDPRREGQLATKTRPKTVRPQRYKVLLYNDDYTPMEFVVSILENLFAKGPSEATQICKSTSAVRIPIW